MTTVFWGFNMWASGNSDTKGVWVNIREVGEDRINIDPIYSTASMTVAEARQMARELYRVARRVEKRLEGTTK